MGRVLCFQDFHGLMIAHLNTVTIHFKFKRANKWIIKDSQVLITKRANALPGKGTMGSVLKNNFKTWHSRKGRVDILDFHLGPEINASLFYPQAGHNCIS